MSSQRNVTRFGRARWLVLGLVTLLAACDETPGTVTGNPQALDAGVVCGDTPEEGCPCEPGTAPVLCTLDAPVIHGGTVLCQRGSRICRQGAWTGCEDISLYAPREKDLGTPSPLDDCHPNDFTQTSTPVHNDITTSNGSHVTYSTGTPSGIILTTEPVGPVVNYGLGVDTDNDGAPDSVDDCPTNPLRFILLPGEVCTDPPPAYSFFHILKPGDSPAPDPMNIQLEVNSVDTYILLDTTYSMIEEIDNLRSGLSALMSNVRTVIPDAYLGVGMYRDIPAGRDSNSNDLPYMHLLDPTDSVSTAQSIVNNVLNIEGNYFWPEGGTDALHAVASGTGIGPWVPNRTCTNGGTGWPCFRPGSVPVVIVITDAPFWNGPSYVAGSTELNYANYPGTLGRQNMAGVAVPAAVANAGQTIGQNGTAATAFDLGNLTSRSITVNGSNDGTNANDFNESCGGSAQSGPESFYEFSISSFQRMTFEAYGDFDPTLFLRPISGSTATTIACDRDSGRINDADAVAVYRTGAKIDSQTIPNLGGATTTNVAFSGCQGSASTVNFPMSGCSISTQTSNAALTGCTVPPDSTRTSTFTGCAVDNTPTVVTYNSCEVASTTTTALNSCTMASEAPTMSFTGCGLGTTAVTGTLTGCYGRDQANLSGCTVNTTTPSTTLTGCTVGTTNTNFTGCSNGNKLLENCYSAYSSDFSYSNCQRATWDSTVLYCDSVSNSHDIDGFFITGTGIPAGTIVTGHQGGWDVIYLSNAVTTSYTGNVTIQRRRTLQYCDKVNGAQGDPTIGASVYGSALVSGGTTISQSVFYDGHWTLLLNQNAAGTGNLADISSGISGNNNYVMCSGMSGSAPSVGLPISGTNVPAGTTVSSYVNSGGYYRVTMSNNATGATSAITTSVLNNTLTCTGKSGSNLTAGMTLSGTNIASGATISSATPGTGTGAQTITMSANGTALGSTTVTASGAVTYGPTLTCTSNLGVPLANGMTLTGTNIPGGTTISSFSGLVITMNQNVSGAVSSNVTARAGSNPRGKLLTCTGATGTAPFVGMGITGTGIPSSQTVLTVNPYGTGYAVTIASNTTADTSTANLSGTVPNYSRMINCTRTSPSPASAVPAVGMTLTGTGLAAGTTTISAVTGSGPYTIDLSQPATSLSASLSTATGTPVPVLNKFTGCTTTGPAPVATNVVTGSGITAGTTISSVTGAGPYTITLSANASSSAGTLTTYTHNTPRLNTLINCVRTGLANTLVTGMTLAGTSRITGTPTVSSFTGTSANPTEIIMSANASSAGTITTVTATQNSFNLSRMKNCLLSGNSPETGMTITGTGITGGTTITSATPQGGGLWTIDMSAPGANSSASATSATITTTGQRNQLNGCSVTQPGNLVSGMALTGSLLPVGTTVSSFTLASGGTAPVGPYNIVLSQNATGTGASTASGTITVPLPQLTGCQGTGLFDNVTQIAALAPYITANTAVTSFGGLGTAANPWTINLGSTPAQAGNNLALNGLIPGPTNTLTGCMISSGGPVLNNMIMSGDLIVGGSTITSYTGTLTGPYTIVLSDLLTGVGPTSAEGTITLTSGMGGLQYPVGLAPGRYQLVVDSRTTNQPYQSSPGKGTFQLRITNSAAPASPTTHAAQATWADTVAALNAANVRTIGIASCPPGCSNLTTRQNTYTTCVQGTTAANPSRTAGADRTNLTTTRCGAAYANCTMKSWQTTARCGTIFDECRAAEVAAGKQDGTVRTQACDAAQSSCLRLGSVSNSTDCAAIRTACRNAADVCTTEKTSVSTCINTDPAISLVSDAAAYCYEARQDLKQLGIQTGSVRSSDNTPFTYQIEENGTGLTTTIADAVRDLAQYILFDVTAGCEPLASVGCQRLFQSANIGTPNPATTSPAQCASCSGPTCLQCTPGAKLGYNVSFANPVATGVAQAATTQTFDFFIVLRDAYGDEMSRAPVRLVVPPLATSQLASSGTFTQIYDATLNTATGVGCPYPGRRADWGLFTYNVTIPAGTSIVFSFSTNDAMSSLATAPTVTHTVTATTATGSFDVGAAFEALGMSNANVKNYLPYVMMTATLNSNPARTATPVLSQYNMRFLCIDAE